jgi:cobalt-zinc-cadmium efflux system membrane fusion protein
VWLTPQAVEDAKLSVAAAGEHEIGGTIVTSGKITFDDLHVSHVFSPVAGRVTKIMAQLGQRVKKGDALAVIDSPDIGLAAADLEKAFADTVAAEHEFKRQKELFEANAGPKKDFEIAEDNFRKAKAELVRSREKARLLRTGSTAESGGAGFVLRALIDGEVTSRSVNPGMEVQGQYTGGTAVELFVIGELDPVWVMADAFEMDLARVKAGEKANVKVVAYPDKIFEGTVDWVADSLDPQTRTAKVRVTIPNPEHQLKPEMFATVSVKAEGHKALALPRNAVLRLGDQTVAFVEIGAGPEGKMRFERRPVTVDDDEPGDFVPVLRGITPGEKVVVAGAILLSSQ